jgi:hypothetical protein
VAAQSNKKQKNHEIKTLTIPVLAIAFGAVVTNKIRNSRIQSSF